MASQQEIGLTYNWMDRFYREVFGQTADISCAFYNGDFSKTLVEAQHDKHDWVLEGVGFTAGQRLLDVGCGWGNMLEAVRRRQGTAVGLTLSTAQQKACRRLGFDTRLQDWKTASAADLGSFDTVVCIGAFEHFCSLQEYRDGKQEEIYKAFFSFCASLIPRGAKIYLQTMTWGKQVPNPDSDVDLRAPEGSDQRILGRLKIFYPGSWLPDGIDQVTRMALPHFQVVASNSGREDYMRTLSEWQAGIRGWAKNPFHWPYLAAILLTNRFGDRDFLQRPLSILRQDQREVFVRKIFDHRRIFFEKL